MLNLDNEEAKALAAGLRDADDLQPRRPAARTCSPHDLTPAPEGIDFQVTERGDRRRRRGAPAGAGRAQRLQRAGGAVRGARLRRVAATRRPQALSGFSGIKRRLELVGTANGVTVIDDFAHNPDKIAATLETLHAFPGRLLVMFQPHGFGPLTLMKNELIACFADGPEPGRRAGHAGAGLFRRHHRAEGHQRRHRRAACKRAAARPSRSPTAPACGDKLVELARPGDRIVIMGARDDTLPEFAAELLKRLS